MRTIEGIEGTAKLLSGLLTLLSVCDLVGSGGLDFTEFKKGIQKLPGCVCVYVCVCV